MEAGERGGREEKEKKVMRYQWSKNKIKGEAVRVCMRGYDGNWYERGRRREKEERFIANGGRSGSSECGHVLQRSKSTKIDEARSWLVWKRANDATTRRRGKTCTGQRTTTSREKRRSRTLFDPFTAGWRANERANTLHRVESRRAMTEHASDRKRITPLRATVHSHL